MKSKLNVLITDDEEILRSTISEFLDTLDFCRYAEASNGIEALEYLEFHRVDCILSDIRMPNMDLEQMLEVLAAQYPDVTVIATSGFSDVESASNILERGAHEFLAKPLDLDLLEQSLMWVPARNQILESAEKLCAPGEDEQVPDAGDVLDELSKALQTESGPFSEKMEHSRRLAEMTHLVFCDADDRMARDLTLAALLHEIGISQQHHRTISLPRQLRADELHLAQNQAELGARLIERRLKQPVMAEIVRNHLKWSLENPADEPGWDETRRLSCLMGVLNMVDSLLHDRPDRKAFSLLQAQTMLKQLYSKTNLTALKQVLSAWDRIVDYHAGRSR